MLKNLFKYLIGIIIGLLIVYAGYNVGLGAKNVYDFYKEVQNQEEQMEELFENQAMIFTKVIQNELNATFQIGEINESVNALESEIDLNIEVHDELINLLKSYNKKIFEQSRKINSQNIKIVDLAINLAEKQRDLVIKETLDKFETKETKPSYDYLESVTVYIFNRNSGDNVSIGTGIVVHEDLYYTYIMTNKHVCDKNDADTCNVEIYKYGQFVVVPLQFVRQTESKYDLSLWKTSEYLPFKKVIKGLSDIKKQDKVYSVGSYLGFQYIYTEGTFAGYDNEGSFIFNLPCTDGCSGSGIYDKDGNLVSVVFASHVLNIFQSETSKIIGVPSEIVRLFLRDLL